VIVMDGAEAELLKLRLLSGDLEKFKGRGQRP